MRLALAAAVLIAAGACAPRREARAPAAPPLPAVIPPRPVAVEPPAVRDPNFILTVSEAVPNPDEDGVSFTKVFVEGAEAGSTPVGRKSEERTLKLKLPAGNHAIRLEQWDLPDVGEWTRVDDARQPRERFVRVEDGDVARVELRFSEGEGSSSLSVSREPSARP